jgi:Uma2 family endonuclease
MGAIFNRPRTPTKHRLDVEAYYKMAEAGILSDAHRVELIDGEIIDLNAIGSPHSSITNWLGRVITRAVTDATAIVTIQSPLRLDDFNEPEPDVLVLRPRSDNYRASHPSAGDVLLLIEVSDSSLVYDRLRKLGLYAKFSVSEVWIVDIAGSAVEVFRAPKEGSYSTQERHSVGSIAPELLPGVTIDITALLA